PKVASALDWIGEHAGLTPEEVEAKAREFGARASTFLASRSGSLVLGIFDAVLGFVMTLFLLFFFLRDGDRLAAGTLALIRISQAGRDQMRGSLGGMLGAIFRGSLVCALAQGVAGGAGRGGRRLPAPQLAGAAADV